MSYTVGCFKLDLSGEKFNLFRLIRMIDSYIEERKPSQESVAALMDVREKYERVFNTLRELFDVVNKNKPYWKAMDGFFKYCEETIAKEAK